MKHKILSFLTAFAMVFGVIVAPFVNASADQYYKDGNKPTKNASAPKDEENAHETSTINIHKIIMTTTDYDNWKVDDNRTNGGKITDITGFFGENSKEVAGVYFEIYLEDQNGDLEGIALKTKNNGSTEFKDDKKYKLVSEKLTTEDNGTGEIDLSQYVKDGKGTFVIVENIAKSTYKGENGETLSQEGKAIPTTIVLPATIMGGSVLNLYPKNTDVETPEVVKDYKDEFEENLKNDELNNKRDDAARKKDVRSHQIGDKVDYRVETLFKENTSYETAYWEDNMTAGLTFNQDLKVTVDGQNMEAADYTVDHQDDRGFYLSLTEDGLKKVNGPDKHLVAIEYSATLNEKAIVNIPETNDVDFFYGNDEKQGNIPKATKPENHKITVNKKWDDNKFAPGESATFELIDESTKERVGDTITIDMQNPTYTWENLDNERSYKVVEIERKNGVEASYEVKENGTIEVVNHKGNNNEINPKEPRIVHYGKKFVKVRKDTKEGLQGAKFIIANEKGDKYLAQKSDTEKADDRQAYTLEKAIYDKMVIDHQNDQTITQAKLDEEYNKVLPLYEKLNTTYEWVDNKDDANLVVLESKEGGRFAIDGLNEGNYNLIEKEAPEGYAEIKEPIAFTVDKDSWNSEGDVDFAVDDQNVVKDGNSAKRVDNAILTIPQTGGIGSIIFVVAGLALMGLAAYKIKANRQEA